MIWHLVAGALAMLALSAIFICWPRRASAQNNQTPAQLFEERLQLLVLARDAGELAEQDFASAASELKQQFLEQEQQAVRYQQPRHKAMFHLTLVLLTAVIVGLTYSQSGHYRQLQDLELAQRTLAELGTRFMQEDPTLTVRDAQLLSLGLRSKLEKQKSDPIGWMVLGQVFLTLGVYEEAKESFERALAFNSSHTPLLLRYSQALIMLGGDLNLAKAGQSVAQVLMREPENIDAVSLMALIAYGRGDNEQAIAAWQLLAERLDADDPRLEVVNERLAELTARLAPTPADAMDGRQIQLELEVAAELAAAHPDAMILVFVRAVGGPPIPLAAKRIPMQAGKLTVQLTTADAMQQGWDLNQADQIEVVARMTVSGTVERSDADVEVNSAALRFDQPAIRLALTLED